MEQLIDLLEENSCLWDVCSLNRYRKSLGQKGLLLRPKQRPYANNVGSCCVRLHHAPRNNCQQLPTLLGPTMLWLVASVCMGLYCLSFQEDKSVVNFARRTNDINYCVWRVLRDKNKTEIFKDYHNFKQLYWVENYFHPGEDLLVVDFFMADYSFLHKNMPKLKGRFFDLTCEFNLLAYSYSLSLFMFILTTQSICSC